MSTRSVIAVPDGESWKGRYVHWDGYPTGVGAQVLEIVQRDGVVKAREVLTTEHYGWSVVSSDCTDEVGPSDSDPNRWVPVPGYGVAYVNGTEQPDEWIEFGENKSWCEWAYVLHDDFLAVYEAVDSAWQHRVNIRWTKQDGLGVLLALETGDLT